MPHFRTKRGRIRRWSGVSVVTKCENLCNAARCNLRVAWECVLSAEFFWLQNRIVFISVYFVFVLFSTHTLLHFVVTPALCNFLKFRSSYEILTAMTIILNIITKSLMIVRKESSLTVGLCNVLCIQVRLCDVPCFTVISFGIIRFFWYFIYFDFYRVANLLFIFSRL